MLVSFSASLPFLYDIKLFNVFLRWTLDSRGNCFVHMYMYVAYWYWNNLFHVSFNSQSQCCYLKLVLPHQSYLVFHHPLHFQLLAHLRSRFLVLPVLSNKFVSFPISFLRSFNSKISNAFLQLNEVLISNPFDRPRAVFMLEVSGVYGTFTFHKSSFSLILLHLLLASVLLK